MSLIIYIYIYLSTPTQLDSEGIYRTCSPSGKPVVIIPHSPWLARVQAVLHGNKNPKIATGKRKDCLTGRIRVAQDA